MIEERSSQLRASNNIPCVRSVVSLKKKHLCYVTLDSRSKTDMKTNEKLEQNPLTNRPSSLVKKFLSSN